MQLAFLAVASTRDPEPPRATAGAWWLDARIRRSPDEPWLDELRDPALVPREIRRAAVAWFARVEPTPVHRA